MASRKPRARRRGEDEADTAINCDQGQVMISKRQRSETLTPSAVITETAAGDNTVSTSEDARIAVSPNINDAPIASNVAAVTETSNNCGKSPC